MPVSIVTQPAFEPVTLDEAKAHLRVTHDAEDDLITALITAAREAAENYTHRALCEKTLEYYCDAFPCQIVLPQPPVQSVTSVKYIDRDGIEQTLDAAEYQTHIQNEPALIVEAYGKTWPTTRDELNAVRVRYVVGYASAADVPGPVKAALLLMIGHLYENREDSIVGAAISELPFGSRCLLNPYRMLRFL
ncbi:MAG: head-tail connector protein [Porticoccaceae bacterium]|nr:head-tail connector protein [Porticoccaceae bacterium]